MNAAPTTPVPAPEPPFTAPALPRRRRWQRRHLALGALVPVLVAVWLPLLEGRNDGGAAAPSAAAAPPNAAPLAEGGPAAASPGTPESILALGQRLKAATTPYTPRWRGRREIAAEAPLPTPAITDRVPPELVPTAVLLSRNGPPVAILQGQGRRVGDTVLGATIVAIAEGRVDYVQGSRQFTVTMPVPRIGGER